MIQISGALVFSAGTVFWSWGLSDDHDVYQGTAPPADPNVQQAMVNLLADMGVQPADTASHSQNCDPVHRSYARRRRRSLRFQQRIVVEGQSVTVSGTATDIGGVIAGVEVSTDGGNTWHPATSQVGAATVELDLYIPGRRPWHDDDQVESHRRQRQYSVRRVRALPTRRRHHLI